jgi:TonB-linked SusC/RagA family outer membrane protein
MQKRIKRLLTFVLFLCTTTIAFAQTVTVSGTVTDERNETLIGVNVQVKGTTTGTITDLDGKYTLTVPNSQSILVFSYVGYLSQEIPVGNQRTLNVALREDAQGLEEVVVVGYGTQRRVTVTGAVASVKGDELLASPASNLTSSIVGRMPGVIGFQRSDAPGDGNMDIRIRGTNTMGYRDPLIVIDGVPAREGGFAMLSPSDIETMSVLKDAAAAIYGSRAANGVILITTKQGQEGKPTVRYNGNWGFSQPTRMPEMANAFEYATMMNDINRYRKLAPWATEEELQKYKDGSDPWRYPNTNFIEQSIKDIAPTYRHELGVSGGNNRAKYYFNFAANGEDWIFKNAYGRYDQYSIRLNLDFKVNDYIQLSVGSMARMQDRKRPIWDDNTIFASIVRSKPTDHGWLPDGRPGLDLEYGHNPVIIANDMAGTHDRKTYYFQNNIKAVIKVPGVEGLTFTTTGSYDKMFYFNKLFRRPITLYNVNKETLAVTPVTRGDSGSNMNINLEHENYDRTAWMLNGVVNYDFSINQVHNFGIMAGMEAQYSGHNRVEVYRRDFLTDAIAEIDMGPIAEQRAEGSSWEESRLNYFGRVSYNYSERYLLEFVWRYDGSYRFPKDKRYGFFPGIMAAWRASEEGFWKDNVSFIDYFKLRLSYSQTGNDFLTTEIQGQTLDRSIQYLNLYEFGTSTGTSRTAEQNSYLFGSRFQQTIRPIRVPNENITWERGTMYDVGFDLKFLKNRLSLEADLFYSKRTGMLISRSASVPQSAGMTLPRENLGEMSNRGVEGLLRWDDRLSNNLSYYASFNMTYSRDKIDFWDEVPGIPEWQRSTGKRVGTRLYYIADGVFNTQQELDSYPQWPSGARLGDIKYVDYDGDGKITADDRVRIDKRKEPNTIAAFTLGATWKNFDIMLMFQAGLGGHTYIWRERAGTAGNFYRYTYQNRWTEENPMVEHPRTYNREEEYWASQSEDRESTYYLWDTDYLRLKNMEIGYTLSSFPFIKKIGIKSFRIYATGLNLLTFDKVKLQDPEQNDTGRDYPQRRIINFGATLTF